MTKPSLKDDFREIGKSWHDPDFRRGFISAAIPAFIRSFVIYVMLGVSIGYALGRLLG